MYLNDDEEDANPLDHFWMEGDSLAPPCQAELDVVKAILDLAEPYFNSFSTSFDTMYDLGCGDGRICTEASRRFGCNSVGCEIEPRLVERFRTNVKALQLEERVTIVEGDLYDLQLNALGVVAIYLLPESVRLIRHKLEDALRHGCVLICNTWGLEGLTPKSVTACGFANNCTLLLFDASCLDT
jgi:SAM-dependent methyltransferase